MANNLTPQQKQAVYDRGGKLLVSAAAGSGKTKVLVDRILSYLKDPVSPANLDDFLIITYTKAAAAELRGKIATKLAEEIAEDPNNRHLQKQMQRLYLTKISTVHAYCTDLLREQAYRVDVPADFRVAEENECREMQHIVIEKLLDDAYRDLHNDPDFCAFVDTQGFGRNDRQLPDMILKLYNSSRCHMDPDGWLDWCMAANDTANIQEISSTPWAKYLIDDLRQYLQLQINALKNCAERATGAEGMDKPVALLYATIDRLEALRSCEQWDQIITHADIDFGTLSFPRKNVDLEMAAHIKAIRESCKSGVLNKLRRFSESSEQVLADVEAVAAAARGLVGITRQFANEYDKIKRHRRVLDFSDLEHKTLDLLMGKRRYGPTKIAAEIGERFCEVMVDEYQDSNEVQDAIFSAITDKRQNCFMVGDVKQSIYQFRLADPDIFLDKYCKYVYAENAKDGDGRKVLLSKNFRSSEGVINAVNHVFTTCMSEKVGGLDYGEDEMLYEGVPHGPLGEAEVELYAIDVDDAAYDDEAAFVAQRVRQLLNGTHMVRDGDALRPIRPDDIAVLLRSPGSVGRHYLEALERVGVRCSTGNASNMLETEEIQALRSILQIIDNPQQDIPLLAVLSSKVFGFTANELAAFRGAQRKGSIFDALKMDDSDKSKQFVSLLMLLRKTARTSNLLGLIKRVFALTKLDSIFAAMSDGETRMENLLGFYKIAVDFDAGGGKNLNRFLSHLEALDEKGVAVANEQVQPGTVTIMSIHKSKGLEFPVVFLPCLSRKFNNENASANMLCDKDLGIGLSCVDTKNRVHYPSVSKRAISVKIHSEGLSEEMRVLYVAMTRAKDRLIMTYAAKNLQKELNSLVLRMPYTDPKLLTAEVDCPGKWVLQSALRRTEAGAFFAVASQPEYSTTSDTPWLIKVVDSLDTDPAHEYAEVGCLENIPANALSKIKRNLNFVYPFVAATKTPSKRTATQIKGREKDAEAAEATSTHMQYTKCFRKATFSSEPDIGLRRGNAFHIVMQHIRYDACIGRIEIIREIERLVLEGYITQEQADFVNPEKIAAFFNTPIGQKLTVCDRVLREFKFSILDDAAHYDPDVAGEQILLQGVVDCALIDDTGITVIDFKTDRVSSHSVAMAAENYRPQVEAYANALKRIYRLPIKSVMLYFFEPEILVSL